MDTDDRERRSDSGVHDESIARHADTMNVAADGGVRTPADAEDRARDAAGGTGGSTVGEQVGEATGSISGVALGAAIGSAAGPLGAIVGGIAGAVGGWWAGRAVADAAMHFTHDDDAYYRDHYERSDERLADRSYDQVRPAYQLGHVAAHNPDYTGRTFDMIEPDLRRGWDANATAAHGDWDHVKRYVRDAYTRAAALPETQRLREQAQNAAEDADKRLDDTAGVRYF